MAEFTARAEQYPLLGALGRLVAKGDEFARKPFGYENPPAAIISDLLQIPALTRTVENINYGSPLTFGTGQARQLTKDTKGAAEAALNLAPAAGPLVRATKNMPIGMVVKPVGNLNLRPSVLASQLKGPEKQKVGDFIKQINGMKGLTKEGKEGALASLKKMDQNAVVTKDYVENAFEPSKYNIVDLKGAADDAEAHLVTEAHRMAEEDPDTWEKFAEFMEVGNQPNASMHLGEIYANMFDNQAVKDIIKEMSPEVQQVLWRRGILSRPADDGKIDFNRFDQFVNEFHTLRVDDELEYLRTHYDDLYPGDYSYRDYQRLLADLYDPSTGSSYVEKGIAHPDAPTSYHHYPKSDEPLVSHFRGTGGGDQLRLPNDTAMDMDPNSFLIEELQSDAAKKAGASGVLHQPHATAFKAAVQHALEQGHDTVYMPTARTIGFARSAHESAFAPIYDQEVVRHGIEPLSRVEGVSVEPITIDEGYGSPTTVYHKIKISPEARQEILEGQGQSLPGFAGGGGVDFGQLLVDAYNKHGAR